MNNNKLKKGTNMLANSRTSVSVIALLAGAKNLGTALGVGQVCFAVLLVYVLIRD